MSDMETKLGVTTEAKITPEALQAARDMIGSYLRPEGPFVQELSYDIIRNFCNGIGDMNPLFRDMEYGRRSRHGSLISHPTAPMAYGYIGRTRWGLPGVHGFFAGNDWEFFRTWRPGDRMNCLERVIAVEEKESKFSGRLVIQYVEGSFLNQRDELVARVLGWCTRHERHAARERSGSDPGRTVAKDAGRLSPQQMEELEEFEVTEPQRIRGGKVRYWEDVNVGDQLDPIARGPLTLNDLKGINVGVGRGLTHGLTLLHANRHPGHYYRNPSQGGALEHTGAGHQNAETAKKAGAPGAYDYGPGRVAWLATLVSNWMGDAAFLKRVRGEMRKFNMVGDITWCKGKITRKYMKDRQGLVDMEIWGENQRGEITTPGLATVILPSRDIRSLPVIDGANLDLELPPLR